MDPRDFYRPYQDSFGDGSPKGFHQDALRTSGLDDDPPQSRTRKSSAASVQSHEVRSLRSPRSPARARQLSIVTNSFASATHGGSAPPKTLTSRKASFKDLVARFDASPDDIPPMPSHPGSLANSTKNSPVVFSKPSQIAFPSTSKNSVDLHNPQRNASILKSQKSQPESSRRQRPLFGEVLSGGGAAGTAGYGIVNARRRRGSEGSPMHSPNAMFPASSRANLEPLPVEPTQHLNHPNSRRTNASTTPTCHRRANSDFSSASTVSRIPISTVNSTESPTIDPNRFRANRTSGSKIPLSTRRQSLTSESGPSNPSSRTTSKLDNYPPAGQGTRATPTSAHGLKSQPGHKHRRPTHIQSPGQKGRKVTIPQGEKSPSLRANIIAPPPKISPPLRGSRQRLPVSSATTAASRARMAEKFQTMAREQIDKKSTSRITRPPELTDIDFNARRLKITQALSRSREEQDLRGQISHGRRDTKSRSHSVVNPDPNLEDSVEGQTRSPDIPALVVQSPNIDDDDVFRTPTEDTSHHDSAFTQSALLALDTQHSYFENDDSPTLGQADQDTYSRSPEESQDENKQNCLLEPASAVTETTVGTLNTPIDNESQVDESPTNDPKFSLLTQVTSMRDQDASTPLSGVSPSDHADAESVHLFLRNTTYDMDEDEAVAKGYRHFLADPPVPKIPNTSDVHRSSWTSSIADHSDGTANNEPLEHEGDSTSEAHRAITVTHDEPTSLAHSHLEPSDKLTDNTAASDAYTIVIIVLQEQSTSGVVDQQLVDDIYQRLLIQEPQITEANILDEHRVVEICLRELDEYNERGWPSEANDELTHEPQDFTPAQDSRDVRKSVEDDDGARSVVYEEHPPPAPPKDLYPPPSFRTHKYKSSLDSAEDWADTSPSVGDWMQFALARNSVSSNPNERSPLAQETVAGQLEEHSTADQSGSEPVDPITRQYSRPSLIASPPPRPPSHSPPPPPDHTMPSIDQTSIAIPDAVPVTLSEGPQIPHRVASLSQMSHTQLPDRSTASLELTPTAEVTGEDESPDQRRMKQRKHVLRELVDTEFSYERDLRVLCDIYKQTALTVLTEDDVKVLFGNVDSVQSFAKEFLTTLKQVARPAYIMERQDRRKELTRTPTSTSISDRASIRTDTPDMTDAEKDRQTRIGQAFEASMPDMETTYKEYIRGRHLANQRLTQLQTLPGVRQWLNECSQNSTDITNAWSLDALLVKPIQRITKYPLLLNQLLESTSADHPDFGHLRRAFTEVTDINIRINEIKKHTEIVDQVMNRKRKESDVRAGLTKAFGRRAEKLRQHVGINESYEDGEYDRLKIEYDNNTVHLLIVSKDCQGYIDAIRGWVVRMCELAAAAESWLDVGHSNHPEAESKLRQLAMAVRGINSIALPDHSELVMRKVIQPMEKALVLLERFKSDTKGLLSKREKKILDYNQAKNKKDRGEKLDRKMTERMEQWEAINVEAKERMRKLRQTSTSLVQSCLANLIQLNMAWLAMIEQKFAAAMAIPIEGLEHMDLIKEWQVDYDFQHAFTMSLGICNGTLLAEAMNLMSFLTPGSTLNGEESPRQSSWNSGAKGSISMNSEGSHLPENGPRYSGHHSSQSDYPEGSSSGQNSARNRATSLASGRTLHTPDLSGRSTGLGANLPNGHSSRPGTSPGRSDEGSTPAPRVSLDAPSPSLGALRSSSPARPGSASTFFSAAAGPSNYASQPVSGGSSIFSSAMPMSDSPETERHPGVGFGDEEPEVLFTAASVYEFNIDRARQEGGIPYLTYVGGEIFDVIGARGELWLARNQDDANRQVGWIWNKHFAKLAT